MTDLIHRLETAAAGSRELDAEIARYLGYVVCPDQGKWRMYGNAVPRLRKIKLPAYTSRIDAALTLLPERAEWSLAKAAYGKSFACIDSGDDRVEDFKAYAQTPALALLSAILKAKDKNDE